MTYIFLPFLSAALYGLSYVLLEKILGPVSMLTYMICSCLCMILTLAVFTALRPDLVSFGFVSDRKILLMFAVSIVIGIVAWMATLIGLQNTSATYVSFAEISYPVFTVLFLFFLFGESQLTWQSLLGGVLILLGSAVLVSSQISAPRIG